MLHHPAARKSGMFCQSHDIGAGPGLGMNLHCAIQFGGKDQGMGENIIGSGEYLIRDRIVWSSALESDCSALGNIGSGKIKSFFHDCNRIIKRKFG
jgi:hypothetical protein